MVCGKTQSHRGGCVDHCSSAVSHLLRVIWTAAEFLAVQGELDDERPGGQRRAALRRRYFHQICAVCEVGGQQQVAAVGAAAHNLDHRIQAGNLQHHQHRKNNDGFSSRKLWHPSGEHSPACCLLAKAIMLANEPKARIDVWYSTPSVLGRRAGCC